MTMTDEATQQWSELAGHMEALLVAWESGEPPTLADYLPQGNLALQVVAVIELIKIDLEQRKARDLWQPLEWYAEKFPEMLHNGEPPCDLIYEEYQIRKTAGEEVDPHEYFRRFPNNRESLGKLLNCYDIHQTTSLAAGRPREAFQPGEAVDDFDLLTKLGSGAFANVFLARQRSMQRIVALKISADKGTEGQTLAQLEHPHIVRVYDQRRLPDRRLRLLYMQYAPGGSLQDVVFRVRRTLPTERTGKMLVDAVDEALDRAGYAAPEPTAQRRRLIQAGWPETVCRIGIQLAQALDYAHHRGILHRDVKPANVLLTAECTAKLADFNISFSSQLDGATPAAYFGGSLAYMSAEQLEACNPEHERTPDSLDGRADLFSLAAMLWELLYGERPFEEKGLTGSWTQTLEELTRRRRTQIPQPPPNAVQNELTQVMTAVLRKALSPNPEDRPPNGLAMARELALCMQPRSKALLEVPRGGIRRLIRTWPLMAAIVVVIVPNLFGAAFNLAFNHKQTEALRLAHADNEAAWWWIVGILNAFYFALASYLVYAIIGPTARAVHQSLTKSIPADEAAKLRRHSLRFGHFAAGLGSVVWLTAGIAFPVALSIFMKEEKPRPADFLSSMFVCGLVSAAYPFFGLSLLATKYYFPALLPYAPGTEEDDAELSALRKHTVYYLLPAVIVPFLGIGVLVVLGGIDDWHRQLALWVLIGFGIIGIGAALWALSRIQDAIRDLLIAVHPLDLTNTLSDSVLETS